MDAVKERKKEKNDVCPGHFRTPTNPAVKMLIVLPQFVDFLFYGKLMHM